jgi:AcrR family transcriptional regulator
MKNASRNTLRRNGAAAGKILDAAARRFYSHGITATGVEEITREAGVAKMSFYNNFDAKDTLVLSYLEARHQEWLRLYRARCQDLEPAAERVLAVFDAYIDHASVDYEHGFRGCGLLNAAAELPVGDPGRELVRAQKEEVEAILTRNLLALMDPKRASWTAKHLSFLLEGAMSRAGLEGTISLLEDARHMAEEVVAC